MAKTEKPDFEKQMHRLEEVTEALEEGNLTLEKSVALYKEGLSLSYSCKALLEKARHEVRLYSDGLLKDFLPDVAGSMRDTENFSGKE